MELITIKLTEDEQKNEISWKYKDYYYDSTVNRSSERLKALVTAFGATVTSGIERSDRSMSPPVTLLPFGGFMRDRIGLTLKMSFRQLWSYFDSSLLILLADYGPVVQLHFAVWCLEARSLFLRSSSYLFLSSKSQWSRVIYFTPVIIIIIINLDAASLTMQSTNIPDSSNKPVASRIIFAKSGPFIAPLLRNAAIEGLSKLNPSDSFISSRRREPKILKLVMKFRLMDFATSLLLVAQAAHRGGGLFFDPEGSRNKKHSFDLTFCNPVPGHKDEILSTRFRIEDTSSKMDQYAPVKQMWALCE
ncbi:NHP2-like protein 1-like protein [Frankliniella fusca]|uniref:NHP2-like protein 1-like protein n=1 Tax=Frankliniella fusca TaxID=407009 RepID=A0AAE1H3M0_9NEOP|nr:NHP2-like protein 1-like protein [Frankliniella fusca]KAK3913929.1 NHP2-like protein 1-like protein [Frankliniella fusca]KAK3918873.1 NHP2-like protein 1-like protein [Frankliniella fusca]